MGETLREKCPYSELFCYAFCRIRTRITPITDILYAVRTFDEDLSQLNWNLRLFKKNVITNIFFWL